MSMEHTEESVILDDDGDLAPTPKDLKRLKTKASNHLRFARKKRDKENNKLQMRRARAKAKIKDVDVIETTLNIIENKGGVLTSDLLAKVSTYAPELTAQTKVGWEPFPGPQTFFLQASEFEVLFSGGRAPGKSDALLMDALRYCDNRHFRGLMIRKSMPDLRDLINRAKEVYPQAFPNTRWKEQEKIFVFPSGARIEFGYCDHEDDVLRYQGQEYSWLGIDELTQIPKEETYIKLLASVRKGGEGITNYVRATTNPNGPGKAWVKRRFINEGLENKTITKVTVVTDKNTGQTLEVKTTRKWIHGTVFDNPIYMKTKPDYIAMLQNIDNETLRKQWLDGDWDSADGLAFDEFSRKVHVIEPFEIPKEWYKFRGCDWGFKTKAVNLWFAIDYDGQIYVYRELVTSGVLAKDFAYKLIETEREAEEIVRYGVLDASAWSMRGENAPPPAEEMAEVGRKENHNLVWRQSDRTKHSRVTGKLQVHNYLQVDELTGKPKVLIFNTCTDLISNLSSLPIDKNNPEDVDTKADDHAYDAFRYGLMSRPRMNNNYDFQREQSVPQTIINNEFGY